jgi:hypothetical protein
MLIASLSALRDKGGAPCAVIDLQAGDKWRLPNLYYLSIILGVDQAARVFFFTEMRDSVDGYFIRSCPPKEFCRLVEKAIPAYSRARSAVTFPVGVNLANPKTAQALADAFVTFQNALHQDPGAPPLTAGALPMNPGAADDPVFGFVSGQRIQEIVVAPPGLVVESPGEMLTGETLRAVVSAADPYVPKTSSGRLRGVIDRDKVAFSVARFALARTPD